MQLRLPGAFAAALLVSIPSAASAQTRYVSTTGSDAANACTDAAAPCLTIQHAIDAATPNDVVEVQDGVYAEALTIGKPLTLRGAVALGLSGTTELDVATRPVGVSIGASNVMLDGITITGDRDTWVGVLMYASAGTGDLSRITVTRTTIRSIGGINPSSSVYSYGHGIFSVGANVSGTRRRLSGLTLTDNVIEDGGGESFAPGRTSAGTGIFLYSVQGAAPGAGAVLRGNTIRRMATGLRGSAPEPGAAIVIADEGNGGPASGVRIDGNTYEDVQVGATVFALESELAEAHVAFTNVPVRVVNAGTLATVDEALLQPFVKSNDVAPFPSSDVYFASVDDAVALGVDPDSASAVAVVTGTPTMRRDGTDLVVTSGGVDVLRVPDTGAAVTLLGSAGDDVLELDFSSGSPLPAGGLTFDGGAGNDGVRLTGSATGVAHRLDTPSSGQIDVDGRSLAYTGLEPIWDLLAAATRTFTYTGASDLITLGDDATAGDGVSFIDAPGAEIVYFAHPTATLEVNALGGSDVIDLGALDNASRPPSVVLRGGDAADVFHVTPMAGVAVTVDGDAPAALPGDALSLLYAGTGATLSGTVASGTISFSTGEGAIAYSGLEAVPLPDLALGLTSTPAPGYPASQHTVTVALANSGTVGTTGVTVDVAVPAGLEILGAVPPGSTSVTTTATTASWTVPAIGGSSTLSLALTVRVLSDVTQAPVTAEVMTQDGVDLDSTPGDGAGDDRASMALAVGELASLPNGAVAMAVTFDVQGRAFAASYGYGVFRSAGTGTWTAVNTGLTNAWVWDVQSHPSGALVASTWGGGLFRSTNQGATWTHVAAVQGAYLRGLALGPDGALYVTGDAVAPLATSETGTARVWRSRDGGATWTPLAWITRTAIEPWSVAIDPNDADVIYVGTRKGAYKSTDGGDTWTATGFFGARADAFALAVTTTGTVLIGTRDGIVRSTNGGATFSGVASSVPTGGRTRNVYDIEYHPISNRLYVANWGRPGVVVSTNDGAVFGDVPLSATPVAPVERVAVAPDGRVFLMLEGGGLMVQSPGTSTAVDTPEHAPDALTLAPAGANPVRGTLAVRLGLPTATRARVDVVDVLGRTVATLADADGPAGWQTVSADVSDLAPGVYVVRAVAGSRMASMRIVIAR